MSCALPNTTWEEINNAGFANEKELVELAYKAGREAMKEKAIKACEDEDLLDDQGNMVDCTYTMAIRHCMKAIRRLK